MKNWLIISCLIFVLALAGCGAGQPSRENVVTSPGPEWNTLIPQEPSAEPTNWGLWMDQQGGG